MCWLNFSICFSLRFSPSINVIWMSSWQGFLTSVSGHHLWSLSVSPAHLLLSTNKSCYRHKKYGLNVCVPLKFTLGLKSHGHGAWEQELLERIGQEHLPFMNGIIILIKSNPRTREAKAEGSRVGGQLGYTEKFCLKTTRKTTHLFQYGHVPLGQWSLLGGQSPQPWRRQGTPSAALSLEQS